MPYLHVQPLQLASLVIDPPLLNASGAVDLLAADPDWSADAATLTPLGAYVTKTLTYKLRKGNPQPWVELAGDGSLFNAVGLANLGLDAVRAGAWDQLAALLDCPIVLSIGGSSGELVELARLADELPWVAAIELNLSCPNTETAMQAASPSLARDAVAAVRAVTSLPLLAKLTGASDIVSVARAVESAGADAVVAINSMPARALDSSGKPLLGTANCGLTGAAIYEISLRCVADVAAAVMIPVIAVGGISSPAAARNMFAAGAAAVGVGSAAALHPGVFAQIAEVLAKPPQH
ncbi:MAG: tRNA-dihydrouridine synthase [Thermoleophilia bacterium]|nr:tRNA-dihydrouridine synthase [Thermoleophilia bacterium]